MAAFRKWKKSIIAADSLLPGTLISRLVTVVPRLLSHLRRYLSFRQNHPSSVSASYFLHIMCFSVVPLHVCTAANSCLRTIERL